MQAFFADVAPGAAVFFEQEIPVGEIEFLQKAVARSGKVIRGRAVHIRYPVGSYCGKCEKAPTWEDFSLPDDHKTIQKSENAGWEV